MNSTTRTTKQFAGYALLTLLSIASHSALHTEMSFQNIANPHLASFGITEKKDANDGSEEAEESKPSLDAKEFSQHERRIKTFELLIQSEDATCQEDISTNHLLRELEVFYGHGANPEENLYSRINRTVTSFGGAELARMLANPTTDTEQIKNRQELVKHLLVNKELRADVEEILNQVSKNESAFLANWEEDDKLTKEAIESLYFGRFFNRLNNSHHALEVGVRLSNLDSCFPLVDPFAGACFLYLGNREAGYLSALKRIFIGYKDYYNPFDYVKSYKKVFTEEYKTNFIERVKEGTKLQEEYLQRTHDNPEITVLIPSEDEMLAGLKLEQKAYHFGLALGATGVALYTYLKYSQTSNTLKLASNQHKGHAYLQTKLLGLARILNAAEDLDHLIGYHEVLEDGLVNSEVIQNLLYDDENADLQSFVSTLRTKTFKGSASFFSRMGRVLAVSKQAEKLKDELIPLIKVIGELDACLSIAKLFEEHRNSDARYCFVQFEQNKTPHINFDGFWHPFIGKDNAVTNSIELGVENKERNVILTGSNTGGKSTLLKAIGINLLLAHTIGLVPSSSAVITPFELISTSLNLSDDTAAGISLFKAEVLRAKHIMNQISNLSDNTHAFLIIDEMFTGTNAKNGADAALSFANKISDYNNVMYIFATHFPLVTSIENESNGVCANYCMDIYKAEDGSLQPTYKVTTGVSTQNIAEDILEEELGSFL